MPVSIITYKGKKIIYGDYSPYKSTEELMSNLRQAEKLFIDNPEVSLVLTNVTGTSLGTEFMNEAKRMAQRTFNKQTEKSALLGVTGLKKVLLNGFNLVAKVKWTPFDSKEAALEYLVSD